MVRGRGLGLDEATLLDVTLSAICSRHRYTSDPERVLEELRSVAGSRTDLLAHVAGTWIGYYGDDYTRRLADALLQIEGAQVWVPLGQKRRGMPPHRTP